MIVAKERWITRSICCLTLGLLMASSAPAVAEDASPQGNASTGSELDRARVLFDQGVAAARSGDHEESVRCFRESYHLYSDAGTLLNLAIELERLHRAITDQAEKLLYQIEEYDAWRELLDRFGDAIPPNHRSQAESRIRALEVVVPLSIDPPGATILVDDEERGTSPLPSPLRLAPGEHTFVAQRAGYHEGREIRTLIPGQGPQAVELTLTQLARVTIESSTENAMVTIDEGEAQPAPTSMVLPPGTHEVRLEAPGHITQTQEVEMPESGEIPLNIDLQPEEMPGAVFGAWSWVVFGLGLASALSGTVLYGIGEGNHRSIISANEETSGMTQQEAFDLDQRGDSLKLTGYILWAVGGALTLTGVLFLIVDSLRRSHENENTEDLHVRLGVSSGISGEMITIQGRF